MIMQKNNNKLRIVFAGTPDISATVLQALIKEEYEIVAVFTQPDRAKGRGQKVQFSSVKEVAVKHEIPVYQPISFKKEPQFVEQLKALNADVMIVLAYGLILPKSVLNVPKHGCLNIHVSLLPRWRGAAPIQRAIEYGDKETGMTIMQMDEGLDTGDILYQVKTAIQVQETSQSLHDRLAQMSAPAMLEVLQQIEQKKLQPKQQQGDVTYAHKIEKSEGLLSFCESASALLRKVCAFTPWPSVFIKIGKETVKVKDLEIVASDPSKAYEKGEIIAVSAKGIDVQTSTDIIRIKRMQFAGKKMLPLMSILNGRDLTYLIGKKI